MGKLALSGGEGKGLTRRSRLGVGRKSCEWNIGQASPWPSPGERGGVGYKTRVSMQKIKSILLNFIFFIQVLLIFLLLFDDRIELPVWLQVAGRLHPALLHLPIGLLVFLIVLLLARNEFKKKAFNKIMLVVLLLTSFTATVTALFGFFLSRQGDYGPDALTQHKISGTLLSLLCYGLLLVFVRQESTTIRSRRRR